MKGKLLIAALAIVLVLSLLAVNRSRPFSINQPAATLTSMAEGDNSFEQDGYDTRRDRLIAARQARPAPALAEGQWFNSEPLNLEKLRGRVVLVDFWTFGCYNCRNTLPALKRLDRLYREQGLTIIGVHAPEFEREKRVENVRREIASLEIQYPAVTDNDFETWRAYGIEAWPTVVILDRQGRIRFTHIGEGLYDEQENVIKTLLDEKS